LLLLLLLMMMIDDNNGTELLVRLSANGKCSPGIRHPRDDTSLVNYNFQIDSKSMQ